MLYNLYLRMKAMFLERKLTKLQNEIEGAGARMGAHVAMEIAIELKRYVITLKNNSKEPIVVDDDFIMSVYRHLNSTIIIEVATEILDRGFLEAGDDGKEVNEALKKELLGSFYSEVNWKPVIEKIVRDVFGDTSKI